MTSYPKIVNLTSLLDAILGRLPKSHTLHKSTKFALHTAKQATNQPSIQQLCLVTKARKASFVPTPDLLKNRDEVEVGAIVSLLNSMTLKIQSFLLAKVVSVVHGLFACYVQSSREGCVDKLDGMTAGYPRKIQNQKKNTLNEIGVNVIRTVSYFFFAVLLSISPCLFFAVFAKAVNCLHFEFIFIPPRKKLFIYQTCARSDIVLLVDGVQFTPRIFVVTDG